MEEFFEQHCKMIRVYLATEIILDPYEKNKSLVYLNPLPIKAIITDLISSQIQWKLPGINTTDAKNLMVEKKYRSLLEDSRKIEIDGTEYEGWKDNGKLQIREVSNYLNLYVYRKND